MKPFDLETYKEDPSREVVTRDGRKARIICTDRVGEYPLIALVDYKGEEEVLSYTDTGKRIHYSDSNTDLFFASVNHKGWINIYKDGKGYYNGRYIYETEEAARFTRDSQLTECVATIPIEWEE